jgi:hypothetical protein
MLPRPGIGRLNPGLQPILHAASLGTVLGGKASDEGKRIFPPQDLRKQRKLDEIQLSDWGSVQNDGSQVWGGILWRIRELADHSQTDSAIAMAWRDLLSESLKIPLPGAPSARP